MNEIESIAIPTADRPAELRECVISLDRHLTRYGHRCEIIVTDNSVDEGIRAVNREFLRAFALGAPRVVRYAGPEEKRVFTGILAARGIPPEVLHFALFGQDGISPAIGANRNAVLIDRAGTRFLSSDHDVRFQTADLRAGDQAVSVVANCNGSIKTSFFSERAEVEAAARLVDADLIAAHRDLLGRNVFDGSPPAPQDFERFREKVFADALEGRGRVLVTMTGVLGDCGMPSDAAFMLAPNEARARYLAAWKATPPYERSREVLRGVERPTIAADGTVVTTTLTGFDLTELLPPYFPIGLGDDVLFGCLSAKCHDDRYLGCIPYALTHGSGTGRHFGPLPTTVPVSSIVITALEAVGMCASTAAADRLQFLSRSLLEIGSVSPAAFDDFISRLVRRKALSFLRTCITSLPADAPESWLVEMRQWIADLQSRVFESGPIGPSDLTGCGSPEQARRLTQDSLCTYARVLEFWPAILNEAAQSRTNGRTIAQVI